MWNGHLEIDRARWLRGPRLAVSLLVLGVVGCDLYTSHSDWARCESACVSSGGVSHVLGSHDGRGQNGDPVCYCTDGSRVSWSQP